VNATAFFFYLYAAIAVAGAIGLVTAHRLVHAVMSMFATLFAIAALYLVIGSQFLAAMQLFVYGGAITVLVLFVLMLARPTSAPSETKWGPSRWIALVLCAAFFGVLAFTLGSAKWEVAASHEHTTEALATILFSRYVLPFEIAGLVLTVALIGAIVLAREDDLRGIEPTSDPESGPDVAASPEVGQEGATW